MNPKEGRPFRKRLSFMRERIPPTTGVDALEKHPDCKMLDFTRYCTIKSYFILYFCFVAFSTVHYCSKFWEMVTFCNVVLTQLVFI